MQFLLTKQIAMQAQNKTLMFYFFMSSGSMYFITLLALFSGIFGVEMSGGTLLWLYRTFVNQYIYRHDSISKTFKQDYR